MLTYMKHSCDSLARMCKYHANISGDCKGSRAERGSRSLWVTCGFTHGNTCKDPDLQVQVTCSHRSLRVQVEFS